MTAPFYKPLYQLIAARIAQAQKADNVEIQQRNVDELETLCREFLPSGSGFNSGTQIELDDCRARRRLVFKTAFHHMHESGMYDGWTNHLVVVEPDFDGFTLRVTGRDRNGIKEYIGDTFHHALSAPILFAWNKEKQEFEFGSMRDPA